MTNPVKGDEDANTHPQRRHREKGPSRAKEEAPQKKLNFPIFGS